jgi:hypothetical protein
MFAKFSGEDGKTTLKHVGQFILQCGEASANDTLKLRMFRLSLSDTAFTWFTSLAPNSIFTWAQLEQKFHEYFYSDDTELILSHLTAIKQKRNESVVDYIRRFRDTRNRCFNLNISDKDLTDLTYLALSPYLKEKLESHVFSNVRQVLQRALDCKSLAKEFRSFPRTSDKPRNEHHVNTAEYSSESSDDEEVHICVAEWSWGSKSKPFICSSLKPGSKADKIKYATLLMSVSVIGYLITCCKKNKLNYKVVMSYHHRNISKSMRTINDIILILMLLMIVMFSVDRFNRP